MMKYMLCLGALLISSSAAAQQVIDPQDPIAVFAGVRFFIVLVTGVVLAVAFQILLTNLGLALGLNILGSKTSPERSRTDRQAEGSESSGLHGTIRKMTSGFGLAAMITAGLSLFFGAWIGMTLTPYPGPWETVALALTIWGLFYIAAAAVDIAVGTSFAGSLMSYASGALRTTVQAAGVSRIGPDETKLAESLASSVQREVFSSENVGALRSQLQKWVDELKPKEPDERKLRSELAKILSEEEIRYIVQDGETIDRDEIVSRFRRQGRRSDQARDMAGRLQEALQALREGDGDGKREFDKGADAAMRAAGLTREESEEFRRKAEKWLLGTGKAELNPEGIKRDLEKIVRDPRGGAEGMMDRLSQIDRSTVEAALAQRKDISPADAKRAVDQVESAVAVLTERSQAAVSRGGARAEEAKGIPESIRRKIAEYLNSLGRPELRYEGIEEDVRLLFHDPKAGAEELYERLRAMDRNTLKAVVASRSDMSEEDAEYVVRRLEDARDSALHKAQQAKEKIQDALERARLAALRQADETRRDAMVAAWWGVAVALVSAGLTILGAFIPVWA